jgi:hypothetical protein
MSMVVSCPLAETGHRLIENGLDGVLDKAGFQGVAKEVLGDSTRAGESLSAGLAGGN